MNRIGQALSRLVREAQRRKVLRTAALYVVGAWLALQVADVLFPGFGIPETAIQALVWAAILGLPVALVFGWLFEIGPGGIRRTPPADAADTEPSRPLRRSDYLLLAAFAVVVSALVYRAAQDVRRTPAGVEQPASLAEGRERLANSVAVLPFVNISNDADNEFFCDGISEEILTELARFHELNVIGRASSFAFKGSDYGVDRISAALGVRYVLSGSVRKAGEQLRISAQLLDADGRQVWAQAFDRELRNIFEIQSEIAAAVAGTVAEHVTTQPRDGAAPQLEAYQQYLTGRALLHARDRTGAIAALERAIAADPQFAEAYAELGIARLIGITDAESRRAAAEAIDRALALNPGLLRARAAQGFRLMQQAPPDLAGAEREFRVVLAQDPNMSDVLMWLSAVLDQQGHDDDSLAMLERAALVDPLHPSIATNLATRLLENGDTERARRMLERQLEQPRPSYQTYFALRDLYQATGQLVDLHRIARAQVLDPRNVTLWSLALSHALTGDWTATATWLERSVRENPDWPTNPFFVAAIPAWQGRLDEAARRLFAAIRERGIELAGLQGEIRIGAGAVAARGGDYAAAIGLLEPLIDPDQPGTSEGLAPELYGAHALAWAYLQTGKEAQARRLLDGEATVCTARAAEGRRSDSARLHLCAETELLRGNVDAALDGLERAIAAGWRNVYLRDNDPYWATLRSHPRYQQLIATARADVDRQAVEIHRIEAADSIAAKLDATLAERRRAAH